MTLLEIVVALVILALILTGLSNVFVVARRYLNHSRARIAAGETGKYLMSPLACGVRQDTFDSGDLAVTASRPGETLTLDHLNYTSTFQISNVTVGGTGMVRRVNLTIRWNETSY